MKLNIRHLGLEGEEVKELTMVYDDNTVVFLEVETDKGFKILKLK